MRAILHIGAEKTGSTAVQRLLAANRGTLRDRRRVLYPQSLVIGSGGNHRKLVTTAMDAERLGDDTRAAAGVRTRSDVPRHREQVACDLRDELQQADRPQIVIFSSEHCQSRLTSQNEVDRLARFMEQFFDSVDVHVYLRPQFEVALSLYSTRIKVGHTGGDKFCRDVTAPEYFDYDSMLDRWESAFGADRIHVRRFGDRYLKDGNVVADFLQWLDLGGLDLRPAADRANRSLSPRGLAVLGAMNHVFPRRVAGHANPLRPRLVAAVERVFPGGGPHAGRGEIEEFFAQFEQSNESVRKRYFSESAELFDVDLSRYGERVE